MALPSITVSGDRKRAIGIEKILKISASRNFLAEALFFNTLLVWGGFRLGT
ncbi:hypothetical protein MUU48_09205 [Scandinavium sp. H11S7]|uniref:hypothetical protein n=1 Tax=Scandinavium hiltneri TaxID=2926519 RepID=UPI00216525A8|nr:hypothetical protein [Scandinavium hiltneri]MCS2157089.1 hypothetical protein [Scandinavium hiltneri]